MDWLHDPRFVRVRNAVIAHLKRKEYHFRKVGTVVFLCGGSESPRRDRLAEYLHRTRRDCSVFYAETAWDVIVQHSPTANALAIEARLAELADIIIIVVESPGTFAELGAFANNKLLRHKLLPIIDISHRSSKSFINTGPVRWVDDDSEFRPSIWTHQDMILRVAEEIEERINRIAPSKGSHRVPNLLQSSKHLLFFICDLVAVFGPCPISHIEFLAAQVLDAEVPDIALLLGLGKAMGILDSFYFHNTIMFYRPLESGRLKSFQHTRKYIDIPTLRARVISTMQVCESSAPVVKALGDALCT